MWTNDAYPSVAHISQIVYAVLVLVAVVFSLGDKSSKIFGSLCPLICSHDLNYFIRYLSVLWSLFSAFVFSVSLYGMINADNVNIDTFVMLSSVLCVTSTIVAVTIHSLSWGEAARVQSVHVICSELISSSGPSHLPRWLRLLYAFHNQSHQYFHRLCCC
jgi:hypothetical protein